MIEILETVAIMEAFGMGSSINQAPGTEDLKKFGDNPTGLCVFLYRICFCFFSFELGFVVLQMLV